jgi:hypothetical protein
MGDRHVFRISGLLGSLPSQYVRLLVAGRTLVALDPHEVDGFALATKFAHHIPDVSGYVLARARAGVAGSCDRARRIRVNSHVVFLHYFGVLWLITTQVKTSDFGVKGGRNGGGPPHLYIFTLYICIFFRSAVISQQLFPP